MSFPTQPHRDPNILQMFDPAVYTIFSVETGEVLRYVIAPHTKKGHWTIRKDLPVGQGIARDGVRLADILGAPVEVQTRKPIKRSGNYRIELQIVHEGDKITVFEPHNDSGDNLADTLFGEKPDQRD